MAGARGIEIHNGRIVFSDIDAVLEFVQDLGQGKTITNRVCPLYVKVDKTSNWYPTGNPSQVNADLWAAWLMVQVGLTPTGSTTILRLESNTKGIKLNSFIDYLCSGVPQGNFDYWFTANPATGVDAWKTSGVPTNLAGYLKVRIGNAVRYIGLYETPP